ncbi:phiSA1p31-related protein [Streptomyces uncialis]|uniref:phiSA1p31-related protein n=1 Tax=Streptomyces uncialis TaxID=1048205 RepID=UPI00382FA7DC
MATAHRETTIRTVEEACIVLRLTETEAGVLREVLDRAGVPGALRELRDALGNPTSSPSNGVYVYQDVAYTLGAQYIDDTGDVWTFKIGSDRCPRSEPGSWRTGWSLADVVHNYGPLRLAADA